MAILHNDLMGSLNATYLQTPHVYPSDYADFIPSCLLWSSTVSSHHHGEETNLFPAIEEAAGLDGKGLMGDNLEQHGKWPCSCDIDLGKKKLKAHQRLSTPA
jgi:hypothetical protein